MTAAIWWLPELPLAVADESVADEAAVDDSVLADPALAVLVVTATVVPAGMTLLTVPVVSEVEPPDSCTESAKAVGTGASTTCEAGDAAGKVVAVYQTPGSGKLNGVGKMIGPGVIGFEWVIGFGWVGSSVEPVPNW